MSTAVPAVETSRLAKRYRKRWALEELDLSIPHGSIAALVGPNGAGKSTLLRVLAGITTPTSGFARVSGNVPRDRQAISQIGYLDQERPLYRDFRVEEMLRFGRELNPRWDDERARHQLEALGIPLRSRIRTLSGGQQAQVALALCLAKRPSLLLLDEPVSALDPVAREDFMHLLLSTVVDDDVTVLISSHAISELANICDYVVIVNAGRAVLKGPLEEVLSSHRVLIGAADETAFVPEGTTVVASALAGRQRTLLVRTSVEAVILHADVLQPTLEEIVLAYLRQQPASLALIDSERSPEGVA